MLNDIQPQIQGVETGITVFMGQTERAPQTSPYPLRGFDEFQTNYGALNPKFPLSFAVRDFFENGGAQAIILRVVPSNSSAPAGGVGNASRRLSRALLASPFATLSLEDYRGDAGEPSGLSLLKTINFDILCLPPDTLNGTLPRDVLPLAAQICKDKNALLIIDPPKEWEAYSPSDLARALRMNGENARFNLNDESLYSYAAVYYPRLLREEIPDVDPDQTWVPCGAIAGMLARQGGINGVERPFAGQDVKLIGFRGLPVVLRDFDIQELSISQVNCLRTIQTDLVVWGAKTLSQRNEMRYVKTRRLLNFIEASIQFSLSIFCFSPNDANTWKTAARMVEDFLTSQWREGVLAGSAPDQAFRVTCGLGSTMTADDILSGRLVLTVAVAVQEPAEFIVLTFTTLMSA